MASVLLLGLTWQAEGRLPPLKKKHLLPIVLLGMTGIFAYNFFFFNGMKLIAAGRASTIVATNPILVTLLSALLFKEKLRPVKAAGILISVGGAVLVISRGDPRQVLNGGLGWGELFIFGCVLSWVTYSLVGKALMAELSPLTAVTYSSAAGALALLVPAYLEGAKQDFSHYSSSSWLGLVYLAVFGTVLGFRWYYEGIKRIGPTQASIFINFVPISAVILAFLLLREAVTPSLVTGVVLVSSGVYLTNSA
jgi:drug/metabolite transporter (DMT)-like permease